MVERKSALRRAPARPRLDELLAMDVHLTDEDLQEQTASFVYGNAPKGSRITKESARAASRRIRVTDEIPRVAAE
jgi:hypothetical protein